MQPISPRVVRFALPVLIAAGCGPSPEGVLRAYWAARESGDAQTLKQRLSPSARMFFNDWSGEGAPLTPTGGTWGAWDRYYRASHRRGRIKVVGRIITVRDVEDNEFYRLIERRPAEADLTYQFDDQGRIQRVLYKPDRSAASPDRFEEAVRWARIHRPAELQHLMPDGQIVPDLARARRWRALLRDWRRASGLPRIAAEDNPPD